jgi:hypothetical protein
MGRKHNRAGGLKAEFGRSLDCLVWELRLMVVLAVAVVRGNSPASRRRHIEGRRVRFNDLRHTVASHPIVDIRLDGLQVSRILGHARTRMILDTYPHLFGPGAAWHRLESTD